MALLPQQACTVSRILAPEEAASVALSSLLRLRPAGFFLEDVDPTCWDGNSGAVLLPSTGHMWNCGNMVRPSEGSREKQGKPWAVINVEKIFRPTTCSPSSPYQHHPESSSFINKCLRRNSSHPRVPGRLHSKYFQRVAFSHWK